MASLFALPSWQQWIIAVVAVIAIAELVSRVLATIRARASTTIYRFDASAPESLGGRGAAGGRDHHHGEEPPANLLMDDPELPPAIADSAGHPRVICPCCGYPTSRDQSGDGVCILCDWRDPELHVSSRDGANADYATALAAAKDHLAQFGTAEPKAVGASAEVNAQRDELRRLYDYLMAAERSDAAAVWSRVDELAAALEAS
jgi:hypothetical protein